MTLHPLMHEGTARQEGQSIRQIRVHGEYNNEATMTRYGVLWIKGISQDFYRFSFHRNFSSETRLDHRIGTSRFQRIGFPRWRFQRNLDMRSELSENFLARKERAPAGCARAKTAESCLLREKTKRAASGLFSKGTSEIKWQHKERRRASHRSQASPTEAAAGQRRGLHVLSDGSGGRPTPVGYTDDSTVKPSLLLELESICDCPLLSCHRPDRELPFSGSTVKL